MQFSLGVLAAISLLAATSYAQSCVRIASDDLGNSGQASTLGLIAERLRSGAPEPVVVQVLRFHIVCEVIALGEGTFRHVSLLADYRADDVVTSSQFEFTCISPGNVWGLITQSPLDNTVTTPPDASFSTTPRIDCLNCLSPNRAFSNADRDNHCEVCPSQCTGLRQCSGANPFVTCCNVYTQDGRCALGCVSPTVQQPDNRCGCPPGTTGPSCSMSINFCDPEPCMNLGTCSSGSNDFSCACTADWTGATCETRVNPCGAQPCQNGGTCSRLSSSTFDCSCLTGFQGQTCSDNINECNLFSDLCRNGGTCQDNIGSYTCRCRGNWMGQDCGTCGISNCAECSPDGLRCLSCAEGFAINDMNTCSVNTPCNPPCVNGQCRLGGCICNTGFEGLSCSNSICPINNCQNCSIGNTICLLCQSGFAIDFDGRCERSDSNQIVLEEIHIVAIIVGSCIGAIILLVLLVCFVTFLYKSVSKTRPTQYAGGKPVLQRRKKPNKHLVKKTKKSPLVGEETIMANTAVVNMEMGEEEEGFEEKEGGGEITLF